MAYYDAISNAIAARGNALAQAAQQQGQVYGNLASNLGQLPFQAMQAGQRRRALEVETQQRELQTQTIQDELNFQKEMSAAISGPGTPEEIDRRAELVLRKRPEKWLRYQELVGRRKQQEFGNAVALNAAREGKPGTVAPQGGYALPMPTQGETVPGGGVGNAFEPVTPMAEQMVHAPIQTAYGPLTARTEAQIEGRKERTAETTAARQLQNQKSLAEFTSKLRPAPRDYLTSQATRDPRSSTGWRWMQWDQEANDFSIPGNEAPPPMSVTAGFAPSQFAGATGEKKYAYIPSKGGGPGTIQAIPGAPEEPLQPRTETTDIRAQRIAYAKAKPVINAIASLSEKINVNQGIAAKISGGVEKAKAMANLNDDVSEYERLVASFAPLVARAQGHTGTLTQPDIDSAKAIIPRPTDSKSLRDRLTTRLDSLFAEVNEAVLETVGRGAGGGGAAAGGAPIGSGGWTAADEAKYQALEKAAAEKKTKLAGGKK